jgi:hypothetical protein
MCGASTHVRFTPDNDRESEFPHKVMSALPPKADMCSALGHVCFGSKADIISFDNFVISDSTSSSDAKIGPSSRTYQT